MTRSIMGTHQGLKLVLEPIFEADFAPVSYGFRPKRPAQDLVLLLHLLGAFPQLTVLGLRTAV
jgi:hypothetical protein